MSAASIIQNFVCKSLTPLHLKMEDVFLKKYFQREKQVELEACISLELEAKNARLIRILPVDNNHLHVLKFIYSWHKGLQYTWSI